MQPWCKVVEVTTVPALKIQHQAGIGPGGRLFWQGGNFNEKKRKALEHFEQSRATVGFGIASPNGFFYHSRSGGRESTLVGDPETLKALRSCPALPVWTYLNDFYPQIEFVGENSEAYARDLIGCWAPVLKRFGIEQFGVHVHSALKAPEQLDIYAAYLYAAPSRLPFVARVLSRIPQEAEATTRNWQGLVCDYKDGRVVKCQPGTTRNGVP